MIGRCLLSKEGRGHICARACARACACVHVRVRVLACTHVGGDALHMDERPMSHLYFFFETGTPA